MGFTIRSGGTRKTGNNGTSMRTRGSDGVTLQPYCPQKRSREGETKTKFVSSAGKNVSSQTLPHWG